MNEIETKELMEILSAVHRIDFNTSAASKHALIGECIFRFRSMGDFTDNPKLLRNLETIRQQKPYLGIRDYGKIKKRLTGLAGKRLSFSCFRHQWKGSWIGILSIKSGNALSKAGIWMTKNAYNYALANGIRSLVMNSTYGLMRNAT